MSDVNVTGLSELQAFLDALPAKMEANIMRSALRAGAVLIAKQAKANLEENGNIRTGRLRDSIRVSTKLKNGQATASAKIGDKKAWYWKFIEYSGARAHSITAKNGGVLVFAGGRYRSVQHPGMTAKPFLRPALYAAGQSELVIEAVANQIKKRLTKQGLDVSDVDIEVTV